MHALTPTCIGNLTWYGRIGVLIALCVPCALFAQSTAPTNASLRDEAERAFDLGVKNQARPLQALQYFSQATDSYRGLHERGLRSPALYRNLGNAAVLADRWPEALWAYQVGLKLDPNDAVLREHRDFVRAKVLLPPNAQERETDESWPSWLYRPSLFEFTLAVGFAYVLAWLAVSLAVLRRSRSLALVAIFAFFLAAIFAAGWWCAFQEAETDQQTPLVILVQNTALHQGNGVSYPPHPELPLLPRGLEARLLHRRGGWVRIRVAKKKMGWVPLERVLIVEP